MSVALLSVAAVALDALLGEPKRWHPLVAFGNFAGRIEQRFNAGGRGWRSHGVTAWVIAVLPLTLLATAFSWAPYVGWIVEILALYCALGMRSLGEHVEPVAKALRSDDLEEARKRVGYLVSRQTSELDSTAVARAATESVLENGSDAVFAALFWFVVAGAPGVVLYRLSNTLDAMWGYRNERFERFGWAAAKIDDVLNYIPARLVALTYALLGKTRLALKCWRTQAPEVGQPQRRPGDGGRRWCAGRGAGRPGDLPRRTARASATGRRCAGRCRFHRSRLAIGPARGMVMAADSLRGG